MKKCHEHNKRYEEEEKYFLNMIITCAITWVYFYEPENTQPSSIWKHPSSPSHIKHLFPSLLAKLCTKHFVIQRDIS